ncbi:MAG: hypothetical protein LBS00_11115 [Synergistaceae bacterium]|nr:hypothetical protein [Synergistaceae bacterium]
MRKIYLAAVVVWVIIISVAGAEAAEKNVTVKADIPRSWKVQEMKGPDLEFIYTSPTGETVWVYARMTEGTSLKDFAYEKSKQLKGSTPEGNDSVGYGFTFKDKKMNKAFAEVYREDVEGMPEISGNICVTFSGDSEELLDIIGSIDLALSE